ncbi:unnamed protein product [Candidula unifasciata]|uniref:Iron-sulfur cluster assembly 1 homolog, mitochondrial n=1 Tax=Candidula unifasciata TaxID=100452 RepID=A0A8S4A709_9EUPU|nr:unnamed protein product [Candidula unifasciata]
MASRAIGRATVRAVTSKRLTLQKAPVTLTTNAVKKLKQLMADRFLIDAKAQLTLLGTEMDYHEDKLTSELIFNNPNIKGTCGCGESFSV